MRDRLAIDSRDEGFKFMQRAGEPYTYFKRQSN